MRPVLPVAHRRAITFQIIVASRRGTTRRDAVQTRGGRGQERGRKDARRKKPFAIYRWRIVLNEYQKFRSRRSASLAPPRLRVFPVFWQISDKMRIDVNHRLFEELRYILQLLRTLRNLARGTLETKTCCYFDFTRCCTNIHCVLCMKLKRESS